MSFTKPHQPSRHILFATGSNGQGQLGIGHVEDVSTWTPCCFDVDEASRVDAKGKQPLRTTRNLLNFEGGARVIDLRAGAGHAIAIVERPILAANQPHVSTSSSIRSERVLFVSGSNARGQLSSHFRVSSTSVTSSFNADVDAESEPGRNPFKFRELPTAALVRLAELSETINDETASFASDSNESHLENGQRRRRRRQQRILYEPKLIACAWETTFVVLSRRVRRVRPRSRSSTDGSDGGQSVVGDRSSSLEGDEGCLDGEHLAAGVSASQFPNSAPADDDNDHNDDEDDEAEEEEEDLDDVLLSFGANDHGELGIGGLNSDAAGSSSAVVGKVHVVDWPVANLRRWSVQQLQASQRHVVAVLCALDTASGATEDSRGEQKVIGWGASRHGQLSGRSRVDRQEECARRANEAGGTITEASIATSPSGSRAATRGGTRGPARRRNLYPPVTTSPTIIDLTLDNEISFQGTRVAQIALGASHTLILLEDGRILGLGSDIKNQIGEIESGFGGGEDGLKADVVGCTWNGSFALGQKFPNDAQVDRARLSASTSWRIASTGSNTHGQLGRGRDVDDDAQEVCATAKDLDILFDGSISNATPSKLVCGSEHGLLLLSSANDPQANSRLIVWGWNEHGNLGLGDLEDRYEPLEVGEKSWRMMLGDAVSKEEAGRVVDCWAGCGTSWMLVEVV